jgi:DNA-binding transcriptional regulator YiaG
MAKRQKTPDPADVSLGQRIIEGLDALHDSLKKGQKLEDRFPVRKVLVNFKPPEFSSAKVRKLRQRLGMSQAVFAQVLAVSPKTVELWEREGVKTPMARRLLETIEPWWATVDRTYRISTPASPRARRKKAG